MRRMQATLRRFDRGKTQGGRTVTWTINDAAHLLRRAGFGGSLAEVEALHALGRDAAIEKLLNYDTVPDPNWDRANPLALENPLDDEWQATLTMMYRFMTSARPLQARLTWFWHGHFTSAMGATGARLMTRQINTWRQFATGSFRQFLLAMYKDGAMLRYLNGDPSTKDRPNENFARENMELFTIGVGPYNERDVRESARAFTGWEVGYPDPVVTFNRDAHDGGSKTILGRTGNFNGEDVMRILHERPETPRRICAKLCRHFVHSTSLSTVTSNMTRAWTRTDGDLKAVMRALFYSQDFWYPSVRGTLVKSPIEYVIGLIKRLGHTPTKNLIENISWRMTQMGQPPFQVPNPAGYPTGLRLSGASMLLSRYQFAYTLIYDIDATRVVNRMTLGLPANPTSDAFVTEMARRLGVSGVSPTTRAALNEYLGKKPVPLTALRESTLGVLYLLACSPEYQVS